MFPDEINGLNDFGCCEDELRMSEESYNAMIREERANCMSG